MKTKALNVERDLSPSKVETTLPMPQGENRGNSVDYDSNNDKVDIYVKRMRGYPVGHGQIPKIQKQIDKILGK